MVLVTWLAIKKSKCVKRLRASGYKGAWRARFAVRRLVDSSIREEVWRLEKALTAGKGDIASIQYALMVREEQHTLYRKGKCYFVAQEMRVTEEGLADPVLVMADRKSFRETV